MDIRDLKQLNEYALRDKENMIIDTIKCRRGFQSEDEVEVSKNILTCSAGALEADKEGFNVPFKVVRDNIFNAYKSRGVSVVGFVKLVGKDELNGYYAVGLYDLQKSKAKGLSALDACKQGFGTLIAVMPMRTAGITRDTLFESAFYDSTINVLHANEINGYKGLEIESYHNTLVGNFEFDDDLWNAVESTQKTKDMDDEFTK